MTTEPSTPDPPATPRKPSRSPRPVWLVIGLVVIVGLVTWLMTCGDDDQASQAPAVKTGTPTVLSEADLRAFGRAQGTPVYWAGPMPNRRYELTHTRGGQYYIRYLTPKADVADKDPRFVTVGTYPGTNAYGALRTIARRPGTVDIKTRSGALVVYAKERPKSIYFAFPNQNFQVEVYDPRPARGRRLVLDGKLQRLR